MPAALGAWRAASVLALCVLLAACGSQPRRSSGADTYTVRTGDTLYSIAFRNGIDYHDLARWNKIDNPTLIYPGQRLQLHAPGVVAAGKARVTGPSHTVARAPAPSGARRETPPLTATPVPPRPASQITWSWPASGSIAAHFGDPSSIGKGIDIAGARGDDVYAAAAGRVVYTGSGLIGYGKLIIIKHDETFLSAYGYNDSLFVEQGTEVPAGARVATMGVGAGKRALLHFEIRVDGKPVDPLQYLPPR